jgi:hypothetical protein
MVLCRIPDCGTDGLFRSCENSSPEPRGPKRLRMETSSLQAKVYNTEIKSQSSIYDAWREYGKCIISSELCLHLPIVYAFYMSTRYSARGRPHTIEFASTFPAFSSEAEAKHSEASESSQVVVLLIGP